ncbi:ion channel [Aliibacillus thermotolerans]|uniref:Ion channel n=1 Tax=Aliibacillus thermotolerans TaxID=1834418 RepID=A0ABW0U978_9BACI|nr:ion channel [Aliibacillus thermotolerans]MDA3130231.1 two pore domain potassium channel family protein [Aliibacillus thermotolerans]
MNVLKKHGKKVIFLCLFFINVVVCFAFIYLLLEVTEQGFIVDPNYQQEEVTVMRVLWKMIYFSTITMAAVGYGDLTPVGFARLIANLQAMIGYLFPLLIFFLFTTKTEE